MTIGREAVHWRVHALSIFLAWPDPHAWAQAAGALVPLALLAAVALAVAGMIDAGLRE